eukprot:3788102-Rhodomonas_salina.1
MTKGDALSQFMKPATGERMKEAESCHRCDAVANFAHRYCWPGLPGSVTTGRDTAICKPCRAVFMTLVPASISRWIPQTFVRCVAPISLFKFVKCSVRKMDCLCCARQELSKPAETTSVGTWSAVRATMRRVQEPTVNEEENVQSARTGGSLERYDYY